MTLRPRLTAQSDGRIGCRAAVVYLILEGPRVGYTVICPPLPTAAEPIAPRYRPLVVNPVLKAQGDAVHFWTSEAHQGRSRLVDHRRAPGA